MKSLLMYNYNFKNPIIYKEKERYYIKENNDTYLLKNISNVSIKLIDEANNDKTYYKTIKNKSGEYIINYKNVNYILVKLDNSINIKDREILQYKKINQIYENNWKNLWINKIDHINNIIENDNKNGKFNILVESKDYFIGLAENAILFLEYNKDKTISNNISWCRKRVNSKEFRMPDNIILDNKERDIAEYIKYLFYEKNQQNEKILDFINNINLKKINIYLVFSRLLFPTNYFDLFEEEKLKQKSVKEELDYIVKKSNKYEKLLNMISVQYFKDINEIDWIKK